MYTFVDFWDSARVSFNVEPRNGHQSESNFTHCYERYFTSITRHTPRWLLAVLTSPLPRVRAISMLPPTGVEIRGLFSPSGRIGTACVSINYKLALNNAKLA